MRPLLVSLTAFISASMMAQSSPGPVTSSPAAPTSRIACSVKVTVEASDTPDRVPALTEHYRNDVLPVVFEALGETCRADETLEVKVEAKGGAFVHPGLPEIIRTTPAIVLP